MSDYRDVAGRARLTAKVALSLFLILPVPSTAQVVIDGTVGPVTGSVPGPVYNIFAEWGKQHGANLFHSFSQFDIRTFATNGSFLGGAAVFHGPMSGGAPAVQNILARITSGAPNTIDGIVFSDISGVNLFLMNPAGMVFGPHASINVPGAIHVTSANYIKLADGARFSAVPSLETDALLSSAPPSAFGFLGNSPGTIELQGTGSAFAANFALYGIPFTGISRSNGSDVALIGGDIIIGPGEAKFSGATQVESQVTTVSGRVDLTSMSGPGEVTIPAVNESPNLATGTIVISGVVDGGIDTTKSVVASYQTGGELYIRAGRLTLDNSQLSAATALGDGGTIDIAGRNVELRNGAQIDTSTFGAGRGADLVIRATESVTLSGENSGGEFSTILSQINPGATGGGGAVLIESATISITDGALISTSNFGPGHAGALVLDASDSILIAGESSSGAISSILSQIEAGSTGEGGAISIATDRLTVANGGQISASTFDSGNGGGISIQAEGAVQIAGESSAGRVSAVLSQVEADATGSAGKLILQAEQLEVSNGGRISTSTFGDGTGGELELATVQATTIQGESATGARSSVQSRASSSGRAGDITIAVGSLEVIDGAEIISGTESTGNSGAINIASVNTIRLQGKGTSTGNSSRINADARHDTSSLPASLGDAGDILLQAANLALEGGASVTASTFGAGRGGNIQIELDTGALTLSGVSTNGSGALIQSVSRFAGDGGGDAGDLNIAARTLRMDSGSQINTFTSGTGAAGNIDLAISGEILIAGAAVASDPASATPTGMSAASTYSGALAGRAGQIVISAQSLSIENGAGLFTTALGPAAAGDVVISVSGELRISGTAAGGRGGSINTGAGARGGTGAGGLGTGLGSGGDIQIDAGQVILSDGAQISSSTFFDSGAAGEIEINVDGTLSLSGADDLGFVTAIVSSSRGSGNAAAVLVSASQLNMSNFARIASDAVGAGDGGRILIQTTRTELSDGAVITTSSEGGGDAGDIRIEASDAIVLNDARIQTSATSADGGNIKLDATDLILLQDSVVSTSVGTGQGNGGNIDIDPIFVIVNGSEIRANAFGGNGGNIRIVADHYIIAPDSLVVASSALGIDGDVEINAADENIGGLLAELSSEYFDAARILGTPCAQRSDGNAISLVSGRYEALPDSPYAWRRPASTAVSSQTLAQAGVRAPADTGPLTVAVLNNPTVDFGCS